MHAAEEVIWLRGGALLGGCVGGVHRCVYILGELEGGCQREDAPAASSSTCVFS